MIIRNRSPIRIGENLIRILALLVVKKVTKNRIVLLEDKEQEIEAKEKARGKINSELIIKVNLVVSTKNSLGSSQLCSTRSDKDNVLHRASSVYALVGCGSSKFPLRGKVGICDSSEREASRCLDRRYVLC